MEIGLVVTVIACFICAILSGLGVGSAGIFTLYLTLLAGYPQTEAQALNLVFFLFSAGASLLLHVRHRFIPRRLTLLLILCAVPGTLLGSYLARTLDPSLIRRLFGGMLVVTGLPVLVRRARRTGETREGTS